MNRHERALNHLKLQHAIRWISAHLLDEPEARRGEIIDKAIQQFGLTPRQEEFLYHMYCGAGSCASPALQRGGLPEVPRK